MKCPRFGKIQDIDLLRREFDRRKSRLLNTSKDSARENQTKYLKISNKKLRTLRRKENELMLEYSSFDRPLGQPEHRTMDHPIKSQKSVKNLFRSQNGQNFVNSKMSQRSSKSNSRMLNSSNRLLNSGLFEEGQSNRRKSKIKKIGKSRSRHRMQKAASHNAH